jgi:glycosyltransferase involved in cell wall biosynthesis
MRLALISSNLLADTRGGAEKYVEDAARSFGSKHEAVVLTGSRADAEGVDLVRLPGLPYHDAGAGGAVSRALWHARDQWRPSVHRAVAAALDAFRPDVVWTHEPQGLSAAVFTGLAAHGAPHVHTAHDLNLLCARTSMTRGGEYCGGHCLDCRPQRIIRGRAFRRRLDRFIGVSRYITARHVTAGIVSESQAVTLRVGATPGDVRVRSASETPTFGYIGALARHKGVSTLLDAFAGAPSSWRLLIAGSGPLADDVAGAASRDARLEYLGYLDAAAKEAFFDRVDALVVPSEWEEPGPFVVVEAAVRGIPAVVSDRGGLPESPEAQTFLSGDTASLRSALTTLLVDDMLATASRRLVDQHGELTWSRHLERVEELLLSCVS